MENSMDLSNFIKNFAELFENTAPSEFSAQTRFRELEEWGSLIALSVIAMVNEEYDVILTGDAMRRTQTLQELYDLVKSQG
jgi:acyl carrier protein